MISFQAIILFLHVPSDLHANILVRFHKINLLYDIKLFIAVIFFHVRINRKKLIFHFDMVISILLWMFISNHTAQFFGKA